MKTFINESKDSDGNIVQEGTTVYAEDYNRWEKGESDYRTHESNEDIHVTSQEKETWNDKVNSIAMQQAISTAKKEVIEQIPELPDLTGLATKEEMKEAIEASQSTVADGTITPEKTTFFEKVQLNRPNLFDGNYIPYYISGSGTYKIITSSTSKMCIIPVKPSTMYSINRSSTSTTSSVFKIFTATTLADDLVTQTIDGALKSTITLTPEFNIFRNVKVTTGVNDAYMFVVVTNTNEDVDLQVLEGSYDNFVNGTTTYSLKGVNVYSKYETYSKEEVDVKFGGCFYKEGNRMYITLGKATYTLENYIKESINVSVWRLTDLWVGETEIFKTSDIEGPLKEVGTADFIGGYHGDELMQNVIVLADGNVVDMTSETIDKTTFNRLTVFVESMLNRCDTPSTDVVKRYKVLDFENGKLTIRNTYNILVDNFVINRLCGGGLFSIYKDIVNYTSDNVTNMCRATDNTTTSDSVLLSSSKFYDGTFYGDGFAIRMRSTGEKLETYTGKIQDYATESRPRLKFYFDSILSASGVTYNSGDSLTTSFEIEIK